MGLPPIFDPIAVAQWVCLSFLSGEGWLAGPAEQAVQVGPVTYDTIIQGRPSPYQ